MMASQYGAAQSELPAAVIPLLQDSPELNGRLDDPVWQKATELKTFYRIKTVPNPEAAEEQTTVQIFYTATAIHLGITAYDSDMQKVNRGVPQEEGTSDNPLEWTGDVFEVFLQPEGPEAPVYHFAFNPNGARWDSGPGGVIWNGNWQVQTEFFPDRWQAEIVIPLHEIRAENSLPGTPVPGSNWRANFCRVQNRLSEFSTWSPTPGLFRNKDSFGTIYFNSRETSDLALENIVAPQSLTEDNVLSFSLTNHSAAPLTVKLALTLTALELPADEQAFAATLEIAAGATIEAELGPYQLAPVGPYEVRLDISEAERLLYVRRDRFELFPLQQRLQQMQQTTAALKARLDKIKADLPPALKQITEQMHEVTTQFSELQEFAADSANMEEAIAKIQALAPDVADAEVQARNTLDPYLWLLANSREHRIGRREPELVLGEMSAADKFFADEPFPGRFTAAIRINLAANEYRSSQIVLFPLRTLNAVNLEVTDLVSEAGQRIPADEIELHRVGHVFIAGPYSGREEGRYWPDPLLPLSADEKLQITEPSAFILTIHSVGDQAAGVYSGELRIQNESENILKLDLSAMVHPFTLPEVSNYRSDFWVSEHHLRSVYGEQLTVDFYKTLAETLGRYHMTPQLDRGVLLRHTRIYREENGAYTFDFSDLQPFLQAEQDNGRTHINLGFEGSRLGAVLGRFAELKITERDSGAETTVGEAESKNLLSAYLAAFYEHLTQEWQIPPERLYCSLGDEPWDSDQKAAVREFGELVAQACPAKRTAAGTHVGMGLDDVIDTYCPQIRQFRSEEYSAKDEIHWYTCLNKSPLPNLILNAAGTEPRIIMWLSWKYGINGFLYWSSIYWGTSAQYSAFAQLPHEERDKNRWLHPHWPQPFQNSPHVGDATFFYPTPTGVVPSLRALNIRDGVNDYEYLQLLDEVFQQARDDGVALPVGLQQEIRGLLSVPDYVAASSGNWTRQGRQLDLERERIATALTLLQSYTNGETRVEDIPVDTVTPQMFGGLGDGISNDTLALQMAINHAIQHATAVYIPRGTYRITQPLHLPLNTYSIRRALRISSDWAIIQADAPMSACININAAAHLTIERLHVAAGDQADYGIKAFKISGRQALLSQVTVRGGRIAGITLEKCQGSTFFSCMVNNSQGDGWQLIDCNAINLMSCGAMGNGGNGFTIKAQDFSAGCMLSSFWSEGNKGHGVYLDASVQSPVTLRDAWIEGNGKDGVHVASTNAVLTGLGITGSGDGHTRAIRVTPSASGSYIHGCYVQRGPGPVNYGRIRVECSEEQAAARHRIENNFYRYRGTPIKPEFAPPAEETD